MGGTIGSIAGTVLGNMVAPGIGGQIGGAIGGGIGGSLSGGGGARPETTQATNSLPSWLQGPYQSQVTQAGTLAARPYNTATNSQVAGFNPQQQQAFGLTNNLVGQYSPYFQQALGQTGQLGQQATGGLSNPQFQSYMNPYIQNVLNTSNAQQFQNLGIAQNQLSEQAAGSGAFGNSRFGLAQGALDSNALRDMNAQNAQTLGSGFNTALQGYQTGINQGLNASNQLGSLASGQQATGIAGINALYGAGASQQQLQQSQFNSSQQNALQEQQYPWTQLQNYQNVMQAPASQYGIKTGTLTPYSAPAWQQGLGMGSMLSGMGMGGGSSGGGFSNPFSSFMNSGNESSGALLNQINSNPIGSESLTSAGNTGFMSTIGNWFSGFAKGGAVSPSTAAGLPMYFHEMDKAMPKHMKGLRKGGIVGRGGDQVQLLDTIPGFAPLEGEGRMPQGDFSSLQQSIDTNMDQVHQLNTILRNNTYNKGMYMNNGKVAKGGEAFDSDYRRELQNQRDFYQGLVQNPLKDTDLMSTMNSRDDGDLLAGDRGVLSGEMRNGWIAGQQHPQMPDAQAGQGFRRGGLTGYKKGGPVNPASLSHGTRTGGLLHKAPKGVAGMSQAQGLAMLQALSQLSQQPGAGQMPQAGPQQPQMGMMVGGQVPHSIGCYSRGGYVGDNNGHAVRLQREYGINGSYADGGSVASVPQIGTMSGNLYSMGDLINSARAQNYVNQLLGTNPQALPEGYRQGGIVGYAGGGGMTGSLLDAYPDIPDYNQNGSAYGGIEYSPSNTPLQNLSHFVQGMNPLRAGEAIANELNGVGDRIDSYFNTPNDVAAAKANQVTDAQKQMSGMRAQAAAQNQAILSKHEKDLLDHVSSAANGEPEELVNQQQEQQAGLQAPTGPFGGQMNLPMLAFGSGILAKGGGLQNQALGAGGQEMLAQIMAQRGQDSQYAWRNGMLGINQQKQNTNQQNSNYRGADLGPRIALQEAQAAAERTRAMGGTPEQQAQNWAKSLGQFEPGILTMTPEQQQQLFMSMTHSGQQPILAPSEQQMGHGLSRYSTQQLQAMMAQ